MNYLESCLGLDAQHFPVFPPYHPYYLFWINAEPNDDLGHDLIFFYCLLIVFAVF